MLGYKGLCIRIAESLFEYVRDGGEPYSDMLEDIQICEKKRKACSDSLKGYPDIPRCIFRYKGIYSDM